MDDPNDQWLKDRYLPLLREELETIQEASVQTRDSRKPVELDQQSVGRLSRMDALQQQAMAQAQEARRTGRTTALKAAIARLEAAEFGFCDECGDYIGTKRLDLDPTLVRCLSCAS